MEWLWSLGLIVFWGFEKYNSDPREGCNCSDEWLNPHQFYECPFRWILSTVWPLALLYHIVKLPFRLIPDRLERELKEEEFRRLSGPPVCDSLSEHWERRR